MFFYASLVKVLSVPSLFIGLVISTTLLFPQGKSEQRRKVILSSIRPIHSLTLGVIANQGTDHGNSNFFQAVLFNTADDIHDFQITPSSRTLFNNSSVVIHIHPKLEVSLGKLLANATEGNDFQTTALTLSAIPDLIKHPARRGGLENGLFKNRKYLDSLRTDYHLWLNTFNAEKFVQQITKRLSLKYPSQTSQLKKNGEKQIKKIRLLRKEMSKWLQPKEGKIADYLVAHDAFLYLDKEWKLPSRGSITMERNEHLSVKRIRAIRKIIKQGNIKCLFTEVRSNRKAISTITEGFNLKIFTLDPAGINQTIDENLYFNTMLTLAKNIGKCLIKTQIKGI